MIVSRNWVATNRKVDVDGTLYRAHRLAWFLYYGEWPGRILDHINRIRDDNRIENLRETTVLDNFKNRGPSSEEASVKWDDYRKKWVIWVVHQGKTYDGGTYDTCSQASRAYHALVKRIC